MSRVRWASLHRRLDFDFLHTASGRLIDAPSQAVAPSWAVAGGADFLKWAVPQLREAGKHVAALSVVSSNLHNVSARLRAQDEQDALLQRLRVPLGLAPERLHENEDFSILLCAAEVPKSVVDAASASKKLVWANIVTEDRRWVMPATTSSSSAP